MRVPPSPPTQPGYISWFCGIFPGLPALEGQPFLKPSNSESVTIRTRSNFETDSSCKNASDPARSTTDFEQVPFFLSQTYGVPFSKHIMHSAGSNPRGCGPALSGVRSPSAPVIHASAIFPHSLHVSAAAPCKKNKGGVHPTSAYTLCSTCWPSGLSFAGFPSSLQLERRTRPTRLLAHTSIHDAKIGRIAFARKSAFFK